MIIGSNRLTLTHTGMSNLRITWGFHGDYVGISWGFYGDCIKRTLPIQILQAELRGYPDDIVRGLIRHSPHIAGFRAGALNSCLVISA